MNFTYSTSKRVGGEKGGVGISGVDTLGILTGEQWVEQACWWLEQVKDPLLWGEFLGSAVPGDPTDT